MTDASGATVAAITDDEGVLDVAGGTDAKTDALVRSLARQITARLTLPRPRRDAAARRGGGTLASRPFRGGSDEIDLDKTLEILTERPLPDDEDIIVRERIRARRSVVLLVDVSGSMKGDRLQTAAATLAAAASELVEDALGVIAFWSESAVVLELGEHIAPIALLDRLLSLPNQGLTNVSFPLELAARQLARVPARDARAILLSDCVHNAGPDPRIAASMLPRLDVLVDISGEKDLELARDLAAVGNGTARRIRTYRDVPPALEAIFRG